MYRRTQSSESPSVSVQQSLSDIGFGRDVAAAKVAAITDTLTSLEKTYHVGIITAVIGAPVFIAVVRARRGRAL